MIIKNIKTTKQYENLLNTLKDRFEKNINRHKNIEWSEINTKLLGNPEKLYSLSLMEKTGGEPDVIDCDPKRKLFLFIDCSKETPVGRRNICYDRIGQEERENKGIHPKGNAIDIASKIGIEILNEEEYRKLQKLENYDTKTSSWIKTPDSIRNLGGALFADRRFNQVFIYHNTAPTFYSSRGFRGKLLI